MTAFFKKEILIEVFIEAVSEEVDENRVSIDEDGEKTHEAVGPVLGRRRILADVQYVP